ncbi:MAG TPA: creatininase family protein [Gemmatimonadales bacterium]|jgi:creatinine amidohydrolase
MGADTPWILGHTTWSTVRDAKYDVAVLPWGATEAHNFHLPYATDVVEAEAVARESAHLAWDRGARVVVLPAIPFGVNTGQLDIPLCINMNPATQAALLRDVADSVSRAGVRKLVIVNSHGGNDFRQMIRELQPSTDLFLCTLNWWTTVDASKYFDEPGDHAGELETSVMLHLAAEQVLPLDQAGDGAARRFTVAALREGWAWAPRKWTAVTDDTGVGNPRAATADKGERFFAAASQRIAGFLVELAAADPAALYQ